MRGRLRILARILAFVALIISVAWLYSEPSYKSLIAAIGAMSGVISTFLFRKKDILGPSQKQTVGDNSTAIQAGRDVRVSIGNNSNGDANDGR